jgi:uncharacterized protein
MRALLDVNVLIALLDSDHSLHVRATQWLDAHAKDGWASCPITQNGCVRIMSHPSYPNAFPVKAVIERLLEASAGDYHQFWPDDVSLLDRDVANASRIHGPRPITDVYLLALAVRHKGRFVTLDRSVSHEAVVGAGEADILVL